MIDTARQGPNLANEDHGRICRLGIVLGGRRIATFTAHFGVLHEHVYPRNADVVEPKKPVVNAIITKLGPNRTDFDSRHGLMVSQ